MLILFWIFVVSALYSYALYPVLLKMLPKRASHVRDDAAELPYASLIITAHNEGSSIEEKIRDSLELDYPRDRLQVLIASDASTDGTNEVAMKYEPQGVRLVHVKEHRGKEYAQFMAIKEAQGEILIFSDVATRIPKCALKKLVKRFANPQVGGVSSVDRIISEDGESVGEGLYVQYEMWLRGLESQRAGLVGLSGSFFAARRSVCEEWDLYSPSDFNVALNCARKGYVAISDSDVVGVYKNIVDERQEYKRKVRTVVRGLTAIVRHPEVLNPVQFPLFSFQIWSHKIMRWAVPWFLVGILWTSVLLSTNRDTYKLILASQIIFYGVASTAWKFPQMRKNALIRIIFFFTQVNLAIAHATIAYIGGRRINVWKPSER